MNAAEESHAWSPLAGGKLVRTLLAIAVGGMCGIASSANYYVSSTYEGDDSDGTQSRPFKTIQAALDNPSLSTDDSVLIGNGTYQISSELTVSTYRVTIRSVSGNPADVTIDAQGNCRCLNCASSAISFRGITFANGAATGDGGGVLAKANCHFDDCVFTNCTATGNGGGILAKSGCSFDNCKFLDCSSAGNGGGVYSTESISHIDNVKITGCAATTSGASLGGGIYLGTYNNSPNYGIFNSSIENCQAGHRGGGIFIYGDSGSVISNCNVSLNSSGNLGGAGICGDVGTIVNCTITNNVCNHSTEDTSGIGGSGVRFYRYASMIDGCLIQGNTFANNCRSDTGGGSAVYLMGDSSLVNSAVIGNSGSRSVAFQIASGAGGVTVSNCLFKSNVARLAGNNSNQGRGGMIYLRALASDSLVTDCRFIDNSAVAVGGIVAMELKGGTATFRMRNCLMAGNTQSGGNAGLFWANSDTSTTARRLALENCTIVSNAFSSGYVIHPYLDGSGLTSRDFISVSGCAILFNNGRNAFEDTYKASANVTYCCTELTGMGAGNRTYDSSKPLFEDLLGGNYRPAENSQLLNRVPAVVWMGRWDENSSSRDLGTGYALRSAGTYGVDVVWTDTSPRLSGGAADIGCFERWMPPGFMLLFR